MPVTVPARCIAVSLRPFAISSGRSVRTRVANTLISSDPFPSPVTRRFQPASSAPIHSSSAAKMRQTRLDDMKTKGGGIKSPQTKRKVKRELEDDTESSSRLATPPSSSSPPPAKKPKTEGEPTESKATSSLPIEEEHGIVDRRFYPQLMKPERAAEYMTGKRQKPIATLQTALSETADARNKIPTGQAVVHWFKSDTRVDDNHGLHLASKRASEAKVPLIGVYILSPEDWEAHATAAIRVDFVLRNLRTLREDLSKLDIPLHVEMVPERKNVPTRLLDLCGEWGARHLFANMEYEADELRREAKLVRGGLKRSQSIAVDVVHDTCVVPPGKLSSGSGNQYSVYSPWFRAWIKHVHENPKLLDTFPAPAKNPASARAKFGQLFDGSTIPEDAGSDKSLASKAMPAEQRDRYRQYWPAGEAEARVRLEKFLADRVRKYAETRNLPGENSTAMLSPHFAAGTLSARTAVAAAREANSSKKLDGGSAGIAGWISEVAWRDFYKHVLVHWPYIAMGVPFKPEYNAIEWSYDREHFAAWAAGRTGYPLVDAAVRQMHDMGYVHNRCRMVVASFLCKDLLLDWRMGERYFMQHLIDGDLASNNGGWGFSSSSGVDPQPYFRIFSPLLQSEKFDASGDYIRRWVPELRDIAAGSKGIHDPYGAKDPAARRIAEKNGYPKPIVVHKDARTKALAMYKKGLGRDTA